MLIYTHTVTPRSSYIFNLVFQEIMGISYTVTDELPAYEAHTGPKLAYGRDRISTGFFVAAHGLLEETSIREIEISVRDCNGTPSFFFTEGDFPFDIFAASFYLVSRYEEYLPFEPDQYGRYRAVESLAFREGFLYKPVVNRWVKALQEALILQFPNLVFQKRAFRFEVSVDIDVAFAFKGRSTGRILFASVKDLLSGNFRNLQERVAVLTGRTGDPFDSYQYLKESAQQFQFKPLLFFLVAKNRSRFDKNISPDTTAFKNLVSRLDGWTEFGIHPSYYSPLKPKLLRKEKLELEQACGKKIEKSRQHYLRWFVPDTFEHLSAVSIMQDYSMGYAELPGFRAGICTPFRFFNLKENKASELVIHPVTYMEGSFIEDMRYQPHECLPVVQELIKEVKAVNGYFLCVWHNHTLSKAAEYKSWVPVFEETLRLLKSPD